MIVVFHADIAVLAVSAVPRHNHSAFRAGLSVMLAKVVSRLRDDTRIAECNYQVREWFSDADDGRDESEVDVFGGRKNKLDD